jgi:hypothetical protein
MIDLSTGRKAHTLSIDLERLGENPTDTWSRIADCAIDALHRGTKRNGDLLVFGRVGAGMSPSNEPTTLVFLMFVDSSKRGISQRQAMAINAALAPLGAWIEGTQVVPDDGVPLFMHVDGRALRISVPDEEGDWVRFLLDRPEGPWAFVADVYMNGDDGGPLIELGVNLPVARVATNPAGRGALATVQPPNEKPVVALVALDGVAVQFGQFAWAMLQDRLARLVERCAAADATLLICFSVRARDAKMALAFQYENLSVDFAKALFEVFEDFPVQPMIVARPPLEPGATPLFATLNGELFVLGSGHGGRAIPVLRIEPGQAELAFERMPEGESVSLDLRRVRVLGGRKATIETERQIIMRVAQMVES